MAALSAADIRRLFDPLNAALRDDGIEGELFVVGGAMTCLAWRIGAEFRGEDDVRYLLRHLGIETFEQAIATFTRYYPRERFPPKTLNALDELLARRPPAS